MNSLVHYIYPTAYVCEAIIWYRLMTNMLDKKYRKHIYILVTVVLALIIGTKLLLFAMPGMVGYSMYGTLAIMIFTLLLNIFLFSSRVFEKLIWWGVYYFVILITELMSILFAEAVLKVPMEVINSRNGFSDWFSIVVKILTLMLTELFIRFRKGKLQILITQYKNLTIAIIFNLVLMLGTVIIFYNIGNDEINMNYVITFIFGIIFLITLVTFTLVFGIEKASKKEIETKLKLQQIEMELKQNKDMVMIMENLRKLRHDMNNHIGIIRNFVYTQSYPDLKDYVDQLYIDVEKANDIVISENKILSVLLNLKKSQAKEQRIDFQSFVAAEDLKMQEKDITALLGNILDNAIEGASKAREKKFIDFSIQKIDSGCVILCENSIGEKPLIKKGKLMTSKPNSSQHGIGTENIMDIVAKYQGEVRFDYDEETFNVRVVMPV